MSATPTISRGRPLPFTRRAGGADPATDAAVPPVAEPPIRHLTPVGRRTSVATGPVAARALWASFEAAPVGVGVCDEDGRFVMANDALARLLHTTTADLRGRPFLSFIADDSRQLALTCYFRAVVAAVSRTLASAPAPTRVRAITADGVALRVQVSWTATPPDAEERQYCVLHMAAAPQPRPASDEPRPGLPMARARVGVALADLTGRIVRMNRGAQTLLNTASSTGSLAELMHPEPRPGDVAALARLIGGELEEYRTLRCRTNADGSAALLRTVATPVRDANGGLRAILVQLTDVGEDETARREWQRFAR